MRHPSLCLLLLPLLLHCSGGGTSTSPSDGGTAGTADNPFAAEVVSVTYGVHAGFGQDAFPGVAQGPPHGGGSNHGGTDVLSLGIGGSITLLMGADITDGPGVDFVIFENAFVLAGSGDTWAEPARVEVSLDGVSFTAFPCNVDGGYPFPGCAGVAPVLAPGPDGGISPLDPAVSGGDLFDLADIGLPRARYIRITDVTPFDLGGTSAGFDLDAIAVIPHATP